jgi:hypothetical protein
LLSEPLPPNLAKKHSQVWWHIWNTKGHKYSHKCELWTCRQFPPKSRGKISKSTCMHLAFRDREVMAKDTHRGHLLLCIMPPYCIIPTVTFLIWQSNFWYFLVNSSCLYVLSHKFISHITLTSRFNLMSHAEYIVLCGVSHLVINIIWGITGVWCFISRITLVVDSHLLCHTLSSFVSLFNFWQLDPVFPYWEVMAKDTHRGCLLLRIYVRGLA